MSLVFVGFLCTLINTESSKDNINLFAPFIDFSKQGAMCSISSPSVVTNIRPSNKNQKCSVWCIALTTKQSFGMYIRLM